MKWQDQSVKMLFKIFIDNGDSTVEKYNLYLLFNLLRKDIPLYISFLLLYFGSQMW